MGNLPQWAKSKRAQIRNRMAPLKAKKRRGEPLTAQEQEVWDSCQRALGALARRVARETYDPYTGSGRSTGPSRRQGPVGGVSSVVNGGAPSLGKRR